ncbi:MAG: AtpZ/AtpI family protein [Patescibacteria group bacterium]
MLNNQHEKIEAKQKNEPDWSALSLAWNLGYTIAIPIIALALGGRLLDRKFDTSPLFLLLGVLLSIVISTLEVYRKVKKIIK